MTTRPFYAVRLERFDAKKLQEQRSKLEAVAGHFANYLAAWSGAGGSRHALMGPVARVLDLVRRGQSDFGEIMGRALRTHEMAVPYISVTARQDLEEGVRGLLDLIENVPPNARRRVLEQVEYHVYYLRRIEFLRRLEEIAGAWREFVEERYGKDISAVQRAWGDTKFADLTRLPFPSRKRAREESPLGRDVRAFLEARKEVAKELEETEEQVIIPEETDGPTAE